ncbi:MAG: 4Fe-4S dicluster domain-containing protein [Myxococcota bacterium]|jgi:ferredoxin|nr:4Fe-4S dicluster domain-containing protein [Myxococcota bacterium]
MKQPKLRRVVQAGCLAFFAALVLIPTAAPVWTVMFGVDLAAVLCAALSSRYWPTAAWVCAIAFLSTGIWGRFYCNHACPMGSLQDTVDYALGGRRARRLPSFVPYLVLGCVVALAALGINLAYWASPLPLLSESLGLVLPQRRSWLGAAVLVAVVGLVFALGPRAYCRVLCPSGALYALAVRLGRLWRKQSRSKPMSKERRQAISHLAAVPLAPIAATWAKTDPSNEPLRPPGGLPQARLTTLCIRCGACVAACPTRAIWPADTSGSEVLASRAPLFVPRKGPCLEDCRACAEACPTGALGKPLRTVRGRPVLGLAKIEGPRCVAIAGSSACLVCYAACTIGAISLRPTSAVAPWGDPVFEPTVNKDLCHGCGHCEHGCPVQGRAAIRVFPPQG